MLGMDPILPAENNLEDEIAEVFPFEESGPEDDAEVDLEQRMDSAGLISDWANDQLAEQAQLLPQTSRDQSQAATKGKMRESVQSILATTRLPESQRTDFLDPRAIEAAERGYDSYVIAFVNTL